MEIPKDKILEMLRERGRHDEASQAEQELPDQVHAERDADFLDRFGLDKDELLGRFGDLKGRIPGL